MRSPGPSGPVEIDPNNAFANQHLGASYIWAGRKEEALGYVRRSLELDPDYHFGWVRLGNLLFERGEVEEAIRHYRKAVELRPTSAASQRMLAWALATAEDPEFRDPEAAVEHAELAIAAASRSSFRLRTLGIAYYRAGRLEEAVQVLEESLDIEEDEASPASLFLPRHDASGPG